MTRAGTDEFAEAIFKLASGIPNVVRDADKEATVRNDIGVHAVRYRDPLTDGKGWTLIQTAPAADAV